MPLQIDDMQLANQIMETEDVDPGIRPYLERVWEAGYTTEFSCSGLRCDHEQITDAEFMVFKNPFIIFVNSSPAETTAIYRAARIALGTTYKEEWFEIPRIHVFWKFNSWWFFSLPGGLQDLAYLICLKLFTWVLTGGRSNGRS